MPNKWSGWLAVALIAGCGERDRLTFQGPDGPEDDVPPVATIDDPGQDTVVAEGPEFLVGALVTDEGGVDTVYVDLEGTDHELLPLQGNGRDSVLVGIPIVTTGNHGVVVTVQVFGVDLAGNRGPRAIRKVTIE
ncbi:MAG TPA: hypothetical protein VJQ44_11935 [Gemmatimonadales bacterium]|nr:hypothetical protein [Gemmatimonadales bacterium]